MTGIGFRAAMPEDAALILEWRNDAESRAQSFDTNLIDPDTHMAWFTRKLEDPACFFYVLTVDGEPAGQIRIDVRDAVGEISYTVAPAYRGQGIGTALIGNAVRVCGDRLKALVGVVKTENIASCRCFEKNGFTVFTAEDRRFCLKFLPEDMISSMRQQAASELYALQSVSGRQKLRSLVRRMAGRATSPHDAIFWPASLLMTGLLESGDPDTPASYLDAWHQSGAPFRKVDDALAGYVMTELAAGGRERFLKYAAEIADALRKCAADGAGSYIYSGGARNRYIFADGAGMTALFLIRYGIAVKDEGLIRTGTSQITNFLDHGMDAASGLPYHGYDLESGICHGIIGWGRAAGWLLMGMQACLQPEAGASDTVREAIYAMIRSVVSFQRKDGLFSWQLEAVRGQADTSATGMIVWSLLQALRNGAMPDDLRREVIEAAAKALPALAACVRDGRAGGALAECIDFAQYRQEYGHYPWGQGAVLMALASARGGVLWENGQ